VTRQESGRLVGLGYSDDGADNLIAIIENGRGELRYTRFREPGALAILEDTPKGALIAFEPQEARIGPSDEAVARVARLNRGLYSADIHARMEANVPDGLVAANIRRLEAMRRAGLISRGKDGIFDIAPDHLDRVLTYERARLVRAPMAPRVQSYMPLANQIAAAGPTHLDRDELPVEPGERAGADIQVAHPLEFQGRPRSQARVTISCASCRIATDITLPGMTSSFPSARMPLTSTWVWGLSVSQ